jgi:hypothetical protein
MATTAHAAAIRAERVRRARAACIAPVAAVRIASLLARTAGRIDRRTV